MPIKFPVILVLVHDVDVSAGILFHEIVKSSPEHTVCGLGDVNVITGV
jgi:hypothetical protein